MFPAKPPVFAQCTATAGTAACRGPVPQFGLSILSLFDAIAAMLQALSGIPRGEV